MNLYQHQIDAINNAAGCQNVAFFHDMGLGKTFTGSYQMIKFAGKTNLIVCPKSLVDSWKKHLFDNYTDINVCDLTTKRGYTAFLNPTAPVNTHIGIINYDLVWRRPELLDMNINTLLLDESQFIKNDTSKRTKAILKIKHEHCILLSGSVCGGKYENLWSQCKLLGWDIPKKEFWDTFIVTRDLKVAGRFKIPIVVDYKNVGKLKRRLRQHGAQFLKTEEVINLPEQTFTVIECENTKEYKTFERDKIITLDCLHLELVGNTVLTELLYLRQLAGAYNDNKIKAFTDLCESTDDRLIVFYSFDCELGTIEQVAKQLKRPFSQVNGHKRDLTAYENHTGSITAVQFQAGSAGLNLQLANKVIYFSPPLSSDYYEQSKKRVHRLGQSKPCFYYNLITKDSVENKIYDTLAQRKDYTEMLFKHGG